MKKLLAAALVALPMAACISVGGVPISITPGAVAGEVLALCAYQVPAADIAALMGTLPYVGTIEGIAAIICQAISSQVIVTPPPVVPVPAAAHRRGLRYAPVEGAVILHGTVIHYNRP